MKIFVLTTCLSFLIRDCQSTFTLLILHNNDMHARFEQTCNDKDTNFSRCYGGFARIAHVVKDARNKYLLKSGPPVLYLNAGDTFTGTVWFTVHKWKIAADFINTLKPDAVSLGNHEFDDKIVGLVPFVSHLKCPVLAANIDLTKEPNLINVKKLKKSHVFVVEGVKIGVIGYLTLETKTLASPNKIIFEDEIVSIQNEVIKLQREGVQILIALGHSGYETDKRIARNVDGIDLVVGGHSHTFLWTGRVPDIDESQGPYPTIIKQQSGRTVLIVQAYAFTKYLGRINLTFDSNGELLNFNGRPILLNNLVPEDEDVLNLLEKYRPEILALKSQIIGTTETPLYFFDCRIKECALGNLLTDAMVLAYKLNYNKTDSLISVLHSGGIRNSIAAPDGNITKSDLLAVLPFQDPIIAVNISGKYIKKALENSVYKFSLIDRPGRFLQLSGLIVKYDLKKSPGSRVMSIEVCSSFNNTKYYPMQDDGYYIVLMPIFLSKGGEGYGMFRDKAISYEFLNYSDIDSVITYLKQENPININISGRITMIN